MKLLDLFCGAGGCSVGYARAGFDVTGVDDKPQPDYPYPFVQADAMELIVDPQFMGQFDVYHASPPCPRYSSATRVTGNPESHPDLVDEVRQVFRAIGQPYVIENVPGAPLDNPLLICGQAMGLRGITRHRLFESNVFMMSPGCMCDTKPTASVFGHHGEDRRQPQVGVRADGRPRHKGLTIAEAAELLGVEWMTRRRDVSNAIPPAYTEFIGGQLAEYVAVMLDGGFHHE